jgi:hypothetical protein
MLREEVFRDRRVREDMVFWRLIRERHKVLVAIEPNEINQVVQQRGTVIIPCADGDQIIDLITHNKQVCGGDCHHSPALNGGLLLLSDSENLSQLMRSDGEVLLRHALQGSQMKGVDTLIGYGHGPCGAALASGIRADQACEHYIRAKDRVRRHAKQHHIPLKAVCLWIHLQWPDARRQTFVFKRAAWQGPECVEFRMQWREDAFRSRTTQKYWPEFWPL